MAYTEEQLRAAGFVAKKLRLRADVAQKLEELAAARELTLSALVAQLVENEAKRRASRRKTK